MRPAALTALLGLLLLLAAAAFDAEPLYVPGVAFVVVAAACTAWVALAARGVRVTRTVGARRVLEGQPVTVDLVVSCGRLPLPSGTIEDDVLPGPARVAGGRRATRVRVGARFPRRGRMVLSPPRVVVRDPLGLASREVVSTARAEVLVLPRIEPVTAPGHEGAGSGVAARRGHPALAAEVDLDGLRPHRPGAPASRIYWPALARGGELVERRLRADSDTRPLVVVDPRGAERSEDLDAAIRAAASLCVHLAREGGCAVLLPGDRRPTTLDPTLAGWAHLHVRLALVDHRSRPNLVGLPGRQGPIFYVVARVPTGTPRALAHAPGGGRLLVVPGRLPGRRAVLSVAGCGIYELSAQRGSRSRHAAPARETA
jgi:uncharacterized protein (DUF58 family)